MKRVLEKIPMMSEEKEVIVETTIVTCPNCDSESVEYYHDNYDDLFSDTGFFYDDIPFVYKCDYECHECGVAFTEVFQFVISHLGTFPPDEPL